MTDPTCSWVRLTIPHSYIAVPDLTSWCRYTARTCRGGYMFGRLVTDSRIWPFLVRALPTHRMPATPRFPRPTTNITVERNRFSSRLPIYRLAVPLPQLPHHRPIHLLHHRSHTPHLHIHTIRLIHWLSLARCPHAFPHRYLPYLTATIAIVGSAVLIIKFCTCYYTVIVGHVHCNVLPVGCGSGYSVGLATHRLSVDSPRLTCLPLLHLPDRPRI